MCYACNSKTIITLLYNQDRSFLNAVVVNYTPESQYSWLGSILEAYLCIMAALGVVVWDAYHDCCTIESALFWQRFFIFVWKHQNFTTLKIPPFLNRLCFGHWYWFLLRMPECIYNPITAMGFSAMFTFQLDNTNPLLISTDFLKYPFRQLFQTGIKFQL